MLLELEWLKINVKGLKRLTVLRECRSVWGVRKEGMF